MDGLAIWIALAAVFIALIPVFSGAAAKRRRERATARKHGDASVTYTGTSDSGGRKPDDGGADGGWSSDGGGGDGGGGGD